MLLHYFDCSFVTQDREVRVELENIARMEKGLPSLYTDEELGLSRVRSVGFSVTIGVVLALLCLRTWYA